MKRSFRNLPIKHKLMVLTGTITGIALLVACAAFALTEQAAFRRTMARDFVILADMFADNVASGLAFSDPASIEQTLQTLRANRRVVAACVYDQQGAVVGSYRRAEAPAGAGFKLPAAQPTGQRFGAERLDTFQSVTLAGEVIGCVYIGTDLTELRERAWRYAALAGVLLIGCMLVALLLVSRLQRIISQPIVDLAQTVSAVTTGKNYGVRAHKQSDDELGRLIDGFNEMLVQIQARDSALQSAHDSLEHRVAERTQELAREQARFRFIFDALPVGITWMITGDITSRLVNPAHAAITGVPVARCRELSLYRDATPDEDRATQDVLHAQMLAGQIQHYVIEKRYMHADGSVRWTSLTVRHHRAAATGETQEISTLVDITGRKQAQEALRQEQELLSAILENVADGILACNAAGVITLSNRALREFHGLPLEPIPAERWGEYFDLYLPDGVTPMLFEQTPLFRALQGELVREVEVVITPRHRLVRRVIVSGQAFYDAKAVKTGAVVIVRDITASRQAEAELADTHRRLLDTSRQAGMAEVATSVLHNVGNVLNSVNVSATLVSDLVRHTKSVSIAKLAELLNQHQADLAGFLTTDPRGQKLPAFLSTLGAALVAEQATVMAELDNLRKNIEHIKDIVAMQQAYARTAGGAVSDIIAVSDLIEDALRIDASAFARHDILLVRDYQASGVVTTDKHKVMQILINLLRNAKHACDESRRTGKQITVRTTRDERSVRIAIIDNGVGIPAENLTRIFNHGFTTRKDGHGFGLHSGALAARELGGSLSVQSAGPDKGAVFTLSLPVMTPQPVAQNPSP